jgi:hypothetical protein
MIRALLLTILVAAAAGAPPPDAPLPREPRTVATALVHTHARLYAGIDGWLKSAKPGPDPPAEVTLEALYTQGPMQFMPATWRVYGLGGDVHDPHDSILGAANFLHASGAPADMRRALHAYNPSRAYVDAVLRYARRMGADRRAFYEVYSWQVFVRTPRGDRRVTGPGR